MINRSNCRMCASKNLKGILHLGKHSLVNSYLKKNELNKRELLLPLKISRCSKCSLIQVLKTVNPKDIYNDGKYLYFSKDVPGLSKYYKEYANFILKKKFAKKGDLVIEIASNDGILLQHLKNKVNILGIDAAPNAVLRALRFEIPTFPSLFNFKTSRLVKHEFGKAKVLMANQCIAHVDDLRDFMEGVDNLLDDKYGTFIFETGYWGNMVKRTIYEQIYHDHFSYFSLKVWENFSKFYNLYLFDAVVTPAQDNCSIRVFFSRKKLKQTARLKKLIKEEKILKLNTLEKSLEFKVKVKNSWKNLRNALIDLKKKNNKIVAYGASAKAGTISTCAKIDSSLIDFFIDDAPSKQGKYTPIFHIPILSRKSAFKKKIDYILILAVNYADIIMKKEKKFKEKGGKFIIPRGERIEII